jgi:hypothetical protein
MKIKTIKRNPIQIITILLFAITFSLYSCSSDDEGQNCAAESQANTTGSVSFTIDGSSQSYPFIFIVPVTSGDGELLLNAKECDTNGNTFEMIYDEFETGINPSSVDFDIFFNGDFYSRFSQQNFTLEITTNDNQQLVGTFSGTLLNLDTSSTVQIQNGIINVDR